MHQVTGQLYTTPRINSRYPGDVGRGENHPPLGAVHRRIVRPVHPYYPATKRVTDVTLCLLAAPFALPLVAISALLVRFSGPGPVLFAQERTGKAGRRFKMLKFRTMVENAAELKEQLAHLNELTLPDFKISDDPRVTRVGRLLRKSSLDELPQLWNVLRGEMSLVGPRPTSFHANTYELWQTERLEVVPGITGLWQISGRSDVDFDERLRLDIRYLKRRSIGLDLLILLKTLPVLLSRRGAY